MKVRVGGHLHIESRRQDRVAVRAGDYARLLDDYDAAVTSLVPLLPADLVDRPFPGDEQTKFELLNGWRGPVPRRGVTHGLQAGALVPSLVRSAPMPCDSPARGRVTASTSCCSFRSTVLPRHRSDWGRIAGRRSRSRWTGYSPARGSRAQTCRVPAPRRRWRGVRRLLLCRQGSSVRVTWRATRTARAA